MNTEQQMKQFLFKLSESFPNSVSPARLELYLQFLLPRLTHVNLEQVRLDLMEQCKFFPSSKEILDVSGARKQTLRELATEFVDTILTVCQSSGNVYEICGTDNANFWKEITGMTLGQTKTDLHSGILETRFVRGQWIDKAEAAYLKHDEDKKLSAAKSIAQITGDKQEGDL